MMNDSVRAELLSKISVSKSLRIENIEKTESPITTGDLVYPPAAIKEKIILPPVAIKEKLNQPPAAVQSKSVIEAPPIQNTSEFAVKPTSPTLVEFHSKNSTVPEWRLQLQNAVRQRGDREVQPPEVAAVAAPRSTRTATSGANALKIEVAEQRKPARLKNPTLNSALDRIEKSRQKFLVEEETPAAPAVAVAVAPRPANKNFPFYIASKQTEVETRAPEQNAPPIIAVEKPKLAAPVVFESADLNTNKLTPIAAPAKISTNFIKPPVNFAETEIKVEQKKKVEIEHLAREDEFAAPEEERHFEESEDTAPFSMRFNSALFDLIIGGFLSLLLLSPFMLSGGDWFTFTGLLAFLAAWSVVMFVYLTTTIGFYGRTFGMRLFSLEVVDINGEHYPTLHQAAVSSAVYIFSLAFGGIGFLPLFFNREKRAVHDMVSGTVVVREN